METPNKQKSETKQETTSTDSDLYSTIDSSTLASNNNNNNSNNMPFDKKDFTRVQSGFEVQSKSPLLSNEDSTTDNEDITRDDINETQPNHDTSNENIQIKLPVDDEDDTSVLMTFHNTKPSPLIIVLTIISSISGFMFGYDTGYISSALVAIGTDLDGKRLTYGEKEIITAATSLGALITALMAGLCADFFGRKPTIMSSNAMFLIGAALQCAAKTFWVMAVGRFIMGFGIGIGSLVSPLFISEISPSRFRGRLTVINCLCITGGQLVAYGCGAGLTHVHNGWRILVGLSLIPAAIQFFVFFWLPDTPRYYIMKGKLDKACAVLKRTHLDSTDELIEDKVAELARLNSQIPGKTILHQTWNAIKEVHSVPSNLRALVIACGLQGIQQFTGFNSLMYFSSTIFETVGFNDSTAVSIVVAGTNFIFTVIAFFIIDKAGRRLMLLLAIPGMMVSLILCAIAFHFLGVKFDGGHDAVVETTGITGWGILVIVGMILYVATYAIGIGNVPWQQSELFPQQVRGIGTSYATAVNWAGSLVISSTFLTMLQNITPPGTFALFAALCAVSWVFTFFCYPELSGLELEETKQLLTGGFNIKASKILAKKRKKHVDVERQVKASHEIVHHVSQEQV
ncbi:Myo-inositol transporter 1 [Wickerhamomyces ciferrii]|uniref:Myo-inositol transporter 1 n=1 Tax=Wickerhamomyces ciferrii (strain ATCC 14091 / BCRC 22168 / CBS 111 / JCM 3599 / NBRC 0793 / NRRL Y-1031 F-60-10) TaxID=1206466 RepID=K0KI69_WICCF|nr:Myo-inositol transporter 1 [Wickerhamomyces ciferrii]CCH44905.1 Myo-inositol transporter 1 [Wickerhamomyces ciferrii]